MIIRISKFETVVFCAILLTASFLFALNFEKNSIAAMSQVKSVDLPILMYHHITEKQNKSGKYTVLSDEFEKDLQYIKQNGYNTVTVKELADFVNGDAALPEKPIMITFDDGFESFYKLAFPLLKQYNMKAVVSIIGCASEKYSSIDDHNINYSNLNWSQIKELNESGFVEIQNHGYNMHKNGSGERKGMSKLSGESDDEYKNVLTEDLNKLQNLLEDNCSVRPIAVAYPYGAFNKSTVNTIKSCGFICTLTCEEKINTVQQGNRESLFGLGRFNRESGISTAEYFNRIIKEG